MEIRDDFSQFRDYLICQVSHSYAMCQLNVKVFDHI